MKWTLFNSTDWSAKTFGIILSSNLCCKNSTNSNINSGTTNENKSSKLCTIKILLDSGASASIERKYILQEHHKILKIKRINDQLWQGHLILLS